MEIFRLLILVSLITSCGSHVIIISHRCSQEVNFKPREDTVFADWQLEKKVFSIFGPSRQFENMVRPCLEIPQNSTEGFEIVTSYSWDDVLRGLVPGYASRTIQFSGMSKTAKRLIP